MQYEHRPNGEKPDKKSKSKKLKSKEKDSDAEEEPKSPATPKETAATKRKQAAVSDEKVQPLVQEEEEDGHESENSNRSSTTGKDFEMVDSNEVDTS